MCIIFPASFLFCVVVKSRTAEGVAFLKKNILVSISAFFAACLFAGVCAFFTFYKQFSSSSCIDYFFRTFMPIAVFPAVVYAIFFFFSKDRGDEKIKASFIWAAPFYSIWMPFEILRTSSDVSFFMLFAKPVIIFCMVSSVSVELERLWNSIVQKDKKSIRKNIAVIAAELIFPAVIETVWYFSVLYVLWIPLAFFYVVLTLFRNKHYFFSGNVENVIDNVENVIDKEVNVGKETMKKLIKDRFSSR